MPGYTPSRSVTHYFVQRDDRHPASSGGAHWRTIAQFTDDRDKATAKAKEIRASGAKVRIVKRAGVTGGYTSL